MTPPPSKVIPTKKHKKYALQISITRKSGKSQRLLVVKRALTAGQKKKNDIVIQCPLKRFNLLKKRGNGYELFVPDGITGIIRANKTEPVPLDSLRKLNLLPKKRHGHILPISLGTKAELTFENCRLNLEYVPVPPPPPRTKTKTTLPKKYHFGSLARDQKQFWTMFLISFFVHVSFLLYCETIPLPSAHQTTLSDVPERFVQLIIKPKSIIPLEKKLQKPLTLDKSKPKVTKKSASKKESKKTAKTTTKQKGKTEKTASSNQKPSLVAQKSDQGIPMDKQIDFNSIGILGQISSGASSQSQSVIDSQLGLLAANVIAGGDTILHQVEKIVPKGEAIGDPYDDLLFGEASTSLLDQEIDSLVTKHQETDIVELPTRGDVGLQKITDIKTSGTENKLRTSEVILEMAASHKASITQCYNHALMLDPNLNGRVVVEFTITAKGEITEVKIIASTLNHVNTGLEECVINMIKHWTFTEIPQGTTTVVYPFVFFPVL
ncbi:MAG: TonB family protein [Deltaproteobacteria bacterium]|nr:TonB family protein [Deltaproteobacteria bacterium]